jgi:hypothetical protein
MQKLYHAALRRGILPEAFWGYTMAEASSLMCRDRELDRAHWNHTSSLMAMYAQSKAAKGKKYTSAQFHPYEQESEPVTKKTRANLLDKFSKF